MKKLQLNIGLVHHNGRGKNTPAQTVAAIRHAGFAIIRSRVVQGTEPTLAALVHPVDTTTEDLHAEIANLASVLNQGAIAWRDEPGVGHLTGARAQEWGVFDSALFVNP